MTKGEKQKKGKRRYKVQSIEIYDVLPSIQNKNKKIAKKSLEKIDRSESCL